ncbi:hypothetical protein PM082_008275 [Marasmius tenuissimus]|nr:hypothetical protein PM082_008275 [Marasmius tenuissimus]
MPCTFYDKTGSLTIALNNSLSGTTDNEESPPKPMQAVEGILKCFPAFGERWRKTGPVDGMVIEVQ